MVLVVGAIALLFAARKRRRLAAEPVAAHLTPEEQKALDELG